MTGRRRRIVGAVLVDGTGRPACRADVLLDGPLIAAIECDERVSAGWDADELDATGRVVCPGFVDVHSHADNAAFLAADDTTKIAQGVTTEVTGNCGVSLAPLDPARRDEALDDIRSEFPLDVDGWATTAELFAAIDTRRTVANVCPLVGHGTIRTAVMGAERRAPDAFELAAMTDLLRAALDAGAFGLSSGLIYPPGLYATTDELTTLARVLPPDRVYATHMRNESKQLLRSIDEALRTVRDAQCRLHVSHLKCAGRANTGAVAAALRRLDAARAAGVPVAQDVYPYDAASTMLSACLPPWMHDGGRDATLHRLTDRATLRRLRAEIESPDDAGWENLVESAGGYGGILVVSTGSGRHTGRTLLELAGDLDRDPFDALVELLVSERLDADMVEFCLSETDVDTVLRSPHTAIGSDGAPPRPPDQPGLAHPRLYGTFPRVLGRFVRDRGVLDLPEAVRRMTSLPAQLFSIPGRGVLAAGRVADLVCIDPETVGHDGDYLDPAVPPTGVEWVMQAGDLVVDHGRWLGRRRGQRLRPA